MRTAVRFDVEDLGHREDSTGIRRQIVELVRIAPRRPDRLTGNPAAEHELAPIPSRDQARDVAIRDDDVGVDEPSGADEVAGKVHHVNAADQREQRHQPAAVRFHAIDELDGLGPQGGHLGRIEVPVSHEQHRPLAVDNRFECEVTRIASNLSRRIDHQRLRRRLGLQAVRLSLQALLQAPPVLRAPRHQSLQKPLVELPALFLIHDRHSSCWLDSDRSIE